MPAAEFRSVIIILCARRATQTQDLKFRVSTLSLGSSDAQWRRQCDSGHSARQRHFRVASRNARQTKDGSPVVNVSTLSVRVRTKHQQLIFIQSTLHNVSSLSHVNCDSDTLTLRGILLALCRQVSILAWRFILRTHSKHVSYGGDGRR